LRIHTTNDSTALVDSARLMAGLYYAQLDNHFVIDTDRPPASRSRPPDRDPCRHGIDF
jgi:hypothetical protein